MVWYSQKIDTRVTKLFCVLDFDLLLMCMKNIESST